MDINNIMLNSYNNIKESLEKKNSYNNKEKSPSADRNLYSLLIFYKILEKEDHFRIFGDNFVKQYKNKYKIIINNKEYNLSPFIFFKEIDIKKKDKYLKLTLKGIDNIINTNEIFKGCTSLKSYKYISNAQPKVDKIKENYLTFKINIEEEDINDKIYFLDNTDGNYFENGIKIPHNHDNLSELNQTNTKLYINHNEKIFNKFFILLFQ